MWLRRNREKKALELKNIYTFECSHPLPCYLPWLLEPNIFMVLWILTLWNTFLDSLWSLTRYWMTKLVALTLAYLKVNLNTLHKIKCSCQKSLWWICLYISLSFFLATTHCWATELGYLEGPFLWAEVVSEKDHMREQRGNIEIEQRQQGSHYTWKDFQE